MKTSLLVVLGLAVGLLGSLRASAGEWETDFAKASEAAKKDGKCMLLDFTGSDWCGWCIKLDKEVFQKTEFKDYAEKYLVLVQLDFPRTKPQSDELKAQNAKLAAKYKIEGYPTILILSPEGKLVGQTGYKSGGAEKYVEHLKSIIAKKSDKAK